MEHGSAQNNLDQMYAVGVMAFILFLSTLVGTPVLPQLAEELGADATEIPIVVSASLVTVVLAQLFSGILADRYSRRTLILLGALIGSVSSLLCAVAVHWIQLTFLRVIGGLADAIALPALLAITAQLGKEQPGKFFGILRSSQGLSFVVGPGLGSVFSLVSLRAPFVIDGALSFLAFLAAIGLLTDVDKATAEHDLSVFRGLRSVFSDKRVYLYLLLGVSGLFAYGVFFGFVPTKSQIIGLASWQIGLILSAGAVVFSLVSYTIGSLSDQYGRKRFVIAAQLLIIVAALGLVWGNDFGSLLLFYGLFCVGETITYLLSFVYATDIFEERYIGTAIGAFDALMDLSLFLGPLLAISLHKSTGQIAPVFLLAMFPAILAFLASVRWLSKEG